MNSSIQIKPIAGACGAEIHGVDLSHELDDAIFDAIKQAFLDYQVIFFRDQNITEEQHKAFGRRFGKLNIHPRYKTLDGHPEIFPIRKDPENPRIIGEHWHQDLTHLPEPPLGSILYALDTPPVGGDTLFANQYAAYESLSDGLKKMLDSVKAVHDNSIQSPKAATTRNADRATKLRDDTDKEEPEFEHPIAVTHPDTGRKALFVNIGRTHRLANMAVDESRPLLDYLFKHSSKPEFTCRFHWRNGSNAIWDNRCGKHRALNDYPGHKPYMNRVTINGQRPF